MSESSYWDRTDRFEEKMKMLDAAWKRKDFRLARALAHSLRSTAMQAQSDEENPGSAVPASGTCANSRLVPTPCALGHKAGNIFKLLFWTKPWGSPGPLNRWN